MDELLNILRNNARTSVADIAKMIRSTPAEVAAKIAALGLRVRKKGCYHGLALNVDMDLAPFSAINPCGYPGMAVTQTRDLGIDASPQQVAAALVGHLERQLREEQQR